MGGVRYRPVVAAQQQQSVDSRVLAGSARHAWLAGGRKIFRIWDAATDVQTYATMQGLCLCSLDFFCDLGLDIATQELWNATRKWFLVSDQSCTLMGGKYY